MDAYRARWVIEEFFKALKTGCNFERRQLESFQSLRIALAIFLPAETVAADDEVRAGFVDR